MAHLLIKQIKNGNGRAPRWVPYDDVSSIRDVLDYYDSGSARFKEENRFYQINPCKKIKKKASKGDVLNNVCIPVDIDGCRREDIETMERDVVDFFEKLGIEDYVTINSGNGLHALISIGVQASDWVEKNKKSIMITLYGALESIAKAYGGNIDKKVLESARILRVPYTMNNKEEKDLEPVECYTITDKWKGEEAQKIVELIEKHTSEKIEDQHNVTFDQIAEAFEGIGGVWRRSTTYSYLQHPIRGSKKTLAMYHDQRHFWSFSDKDEDISSLLTLEQVWNMFGSGKDFPFRGFTPKGLIDTIRHKTGLDLRYVTKTGQSWYITASQESRDGTRPTVLSKSTFKDAIKNKGLMSYLESIGMTAYTPDSLFTTLCMEELPPEKFQAEPIDSEVNEIISKWSSIGTLMFDVRDDTTGRTIKTNLNTIIRDGELDLMKMLGINMNDDKVCISYNTIVSCFGKQADTFAKSEIDFKSICEWMKIPISDHNGMVCFFKNEKLQVARQKMIEK
jgi:hypothetical protein